jgi:hypothetical protein
MFGYGATMLGFPANVFGWLVRRLDRIAHLTAEQRMKGQERARGLFILHPSALCDGSPGGESGSVL